jgi:hypothetical protein
LALRTTRPCRCESRGWRRGLRLRPQESLNEPLSHRGSIPYQSELAAQDFPSMFTAHARQVLAEKPTSPVGGTVRNVLRSIRREKLPRIAGERHEEEGPGQSVQHLASIELESIEGGAAVSLRGVRHTLPHPGMLLSSNSAPPAESFSLLQCCALRQDQNRLRLEWSLLFIPGMSGNQT